MTNPRKAETPNDGYFVVPDVLPPEPTGAVPTPEGYMTDKTFREIKCHFCKLPLRINQFESRQVIKDGYGTTITAHVRCWKKHDKTLTKALPTDKKLPEPTTPSSDITRDGGCVIPSTVEHWILWLSSSGYTEENAQKTIDAIESLLNEARGEPYHERNLLVSYLSKQYPSHLSNDPEEPLWTVVCVHTPKGQMGWHIPLQEVGYFDHLTARDNDYDGHTTKDKYRRLAELEGML